MSTLENTVKDKLGIKWVCARDLVQQARTKLDANRDDDDDDYSVDEDEVLLETLKIFQALSNKEQEKMRVPEQTLEPDWKQKAKAQAERRERQWEEDEAARQAAIAREEAIARGEQVEDEVQGPKKIIRVTKVTKDGKDTEVVETITKEKLDGCHIKHTKVQYCTIL